MNVGAAIREVRKEKGITGKRLAEMVGLSVTAIFNIEHGLSFPPMKTFQKICNALEVPQSFVLFYSITEEDVPAGRWDSFLPLYNAVKEFLRT